MTVEEMIEEMTDIDMKDVITIEIEETIETMVITVIILTTGSCPLRSMDGLFLYNSRALAHHCPEK